MFRSLKLGREVAARRRRYPEPWQLGEGLAEDRFELLPGEDRAWGLAMVDDYLREAGQDAVILVAEASRRRGYVMDSEPLSTVGIACGLTLEPALRNYIESGAAEGDRQAIRDYRSDYDRGRTMAENTFKKEPTRWLATVPLIGNGIEEQVDRKLGAAFAFNAFEPPFEQTGVALGAFKARMAELILDQLKSS